MPPPTHTPSPPGRSGAPELKPTIKALLLIPLSQPLCSEMAVWEGTGGHGRGCATLRIAGLTVVLQPALATRQCGNASLLHNVACLSPHTSKNTLKIRPRGPPFPGASPGVCTMPAPTGAPNTSITMVSRSETATPFPWPRSETLGEHGGPHPSCCTSPNVPSQAVSPSQTILPPLQFGGERGHREAPLSAAPGPALRV